MDILRGGGERREDACTTSTSNTTSLNLFQECGDVRVKEIASKICLKFDKSINFDFFLERSLVIKGGHRIESGWTIPDRSGKKVRFTSYQTGLVRG